MNLKSGNAVAASKPEFVNPEDVPADVVEHERQIQIDIVVNSGKPKRNRRENG